jgi:TfoX/Sxy family transcriptional regulator of competence genes
MRSDKPEARAFQDWVTQVVLPSIRKDGGYIAGEEKFAAGEMSEDELILKAQQILQRKVERLSKQNEAMRQELSAVTVAEYVALNHVYFQHSEKTRLAHRASLLAAQRDICIHKQPRLIRTKGREIETQVNVYPRDLLDEAAMSLNLFEAARGTPRPLH